MVVFGVFSDFRNQKLENSKKFPQKIENSQFFCFAFLVNFLQRLKKNYTNLRKNTLYFLRLLLEHSMLLAQQQAILVTF